MELKPEQTVYANCQSNFPREAALKLRNFVKAGGQLIWALSHVVEVAFPNTIKFSAKFTGVEVVAIEIVDKEDEVLKGTGSLLRGQYFQAAGISVIEFIDQEKNASPSVVAGGKLLSHRDTGRKSGSLGEVRRAEGRCWHDPVIVSFEWRRHSVPYEQPFLPAESETRTQKQGKSSKAYAKTQGASKSIMDLMESKIPGINYGMVQSATTSSEFVSCCLVETEEIYHKELTAGLDRIFILFSLLIHPIFVESILLHWQLFIYINVS